MVTRCADQHPLCKRNRNIVMDYPLAEVKCPRVLILIISVKYAYCTSNSVVSVHRSLLRIVSFERYHPAQNFGRDLIVLLRTVSFDHDVIDSHVVFPQIVDHARIIDRVRKGLNKKTVGRAPVVDQVY